MWNWQITTAVKESNLKVKSKFIERHGAKRRLVIPDIHGCAKTLDALLRELKLGKDDQIFFLGDYIDRGPDSKGVLDIVMRLLDDGYQAFPLMGNHENDLLVFSDSPRIVERLARRSALTGIVTAEFKVEKRYLDFIAQLPAYYELDHFFLVHAGFNFFKEKPFEEYEDMLWIRNFSLSDEFSRRKKTIVHGHTPTALRHIKERIDEHESIIGLDNGCVFNDLSCGFFGLLCYNLDTKELICQANLDVDRCFGE